MNLADLRTALLAARSDVREAAAQRPRRGSSTLRITRWPASLRQRLQGGSSQPDSQQVSLKIFLRQLTVALARMLHQCGWPALVGGALIIASIATVFTATAPTREQIAAVEQQRKLLRVEARKTTAVPLSPQTQLANFYAAFPARSALPDALMTLHSVASRNGLHDTRADYRDTPETGTPLVRVRIEIPVTGSYAAIRSWIAELLQTLPTLTLDGLELRRSDMGKAQLDARVRFQLLLRSTP
jgi:Tfp pilus assembly protein PilO